MENPEARLEQILRKSVPEIIREQRSRYEEVAGDLGGRFVLCGSGYLGRKVVAGLRNAGIEPLAFADNNPRLWNRKVVGIEVISPVEAAHRYGQQALFVVTVYTGASLFRQISGLGVRVVSFPLLAWYYPEALLPHSALELPDKIFAQATEVRSALGIWGDEASRREYLGQLEWRTSLDSAILPPSLPSEQTYFPDDLVDFLDEEVYVDCGAFDGDSIREFVRRRGAAFRHVIGIEPDPSNYALLKAAVSALPDPVRGKVTVRNLAVGSRRGKVLFDATGTEGSAVGSGPSEVECAPLDEILRDHSPTYVKMDIEGAEWDALAGSRGILGKHHPVLAICLYHRQEDLWRIPLYIKSVSSRYQLYLRRYSDDCWELVCYAIPLERLAGRAT